MKKAIIGVPSDVVLIDGRRFHAVAEEYLAPILAIGALPRLLPSLGPGEDAADLLIGLDGLLLTGAESNVEPHHYDADAVFDCPPFDPDRDSTTLPMIRAAIAQSLPLLAICRGLQELNVAMGGSLAPQVHLLKDRFDHRAPENQPDDVQYAPRHLVRLTPNGVLAGLAAGQTEIMVNSLHGQAIDRPGPNVLVEATAPDGTIEAIRISSSNNFAIGVQWHPEWRFADNPFSQALLGAFAESIATKRLRR